MFDLNIALKTVYFEEKDNTIMNYKILAIFLAMGFAMPMGVDQLDAASHKKQIKKKKKVKTKWAKTKSKKVIRPKVPVKLKDEALMCSGQQSCTLPPSHVAAVTTAAEASSVAPVTPVAQEKKDDKLPVSVQPVQTVDPKHEEKKQDCDDHIGVYFGLGLGMANLGGSFSATGLPSGNISDTGLAKYGLTTDISFGYLHKFGDFGLGFEGYFDPISMKSTHNTSHNQTYQITLKNTFGALINCGYFVGAKTFAYVRLGLEKQKFNYTITDSGNTVLTDSQNQNTLTGGLGLRHQMGNWAIGAEYIYKKYKDISSQNGGVSAKISPNSNGIRFTLSYVI
ncbi:MAG: hypothetical protein HEEMFOPI_00125 [Holosporales bacterium]